MWNSVKFALGVCLLLVLLVHQGFGAIPVIVSQDFTGPSCPRESDGDYITTKATVTALASDFGTLYAPSVELFQLIGSSTTAAIEDASLDECGTASSILRCLSHVGDVYTLQYRQLVSKGYSGKSVAMRIMDMALKEAVRGNVYKYPLIREAINESLEINGMPTKFPPTECIIVDKDLVEVKYQVSGVQSYFDLTASIVDDTTNTDLVSSTSVFNLTTSVNPFTMKRIRFEFTVKNSCNGSTVLQFCEPSDPSPCGSGCIAGIIVAILVLCIVVLGVILLIRKRSGRTTEFLCPKVSLNTTIEKFEERLKNDPAKLPKAMDRSRQFEFHYQGGKQLDKTKTLANLIKDKSSQEADVQVAYQVEKKVVVVNIVDIRVDPSTGYTSRDGAQYEMEMKDEGGDHNTSNVVA